MAGSDIDSDNESTKPSNSSGKKTFTKFTQSTKEYIKLKKLFQAKKILATDKPADIRHRYPEFQLYTSQQFRSQFNKLKSVVGTVTKEGM
jgi:hypothetical protein